MAVIMSAIAAARPPTADLRPLAAMAATSERPARVGVSTSQYVVVGWLDGSVAEFEPRRLPHGLSPPAAWAGERVQGLDAEISRDL